MIRSWGYRMSGPLLRLALDYTSAVRHFCIGCRVRLARGSEYVVAVAIIFQICTCMLRQGRGCERRSSRIQRFRSFLRRNSGIDASEPPAALPPALDLTPPLPPLWLPAGLRSFIPGFLSKDHFTLPSHFRTSWPS